MAFHFSPKIVTNGLVLCLDVANSKSYSTASLVWNDLTPNQTECLITGSVSFQNNHLYFPGPSYSATDDGVFVADVSSNYNNLTQLTLESWCYPMTYSPYQYLFSNSRDCCGTYNGYELRIVTDGGVVGRPILLIWNSTAASVQSTYQTELNNWYHIVGTYDGVQLKIYVNGVLTGTSNSTLGIGIPSSYNLYVGRMGYFSSEFYKFQGYIDQSRIYNRPLSAQEVIQNYNATKTRFGL